MLVDSNTHNIGATDPGTRHPLFHTSSGSLRRWWAEERGGSSGRGDLETVVLGGKGWKGTHDSVGKKGGEGGGCVVLLIFFFPFNASGVGWGGVRGRPSRAT
eukprot:Sspe_Gene.19172::Locus_6962_Transcript_1_1_Confidence_1.000_Length_731::g.19172::m.19172